MKTYVERRPRFVAFYYEPRYVSEFLEQIRDRYSSFSFDGSTQNLTLVRNEVLLILFPMSYLVFNEDGNAFVVSASDFRKQFEEA